MKYSKDYYKALGVAENATPEEIKKVYRKLAIQFHPDKNKGNQQAEDRFKEISEAYYVLSDSKRRAEFDQYRKFGGVGPQGGGFHGADGFNFEDLLRSYGRQGGARGRAQSYSGFADIFEELFSGGPGRGASSMHDFFGQNVKGTYAPPPNLDESGTLKISSERARQGGAVKIKSKNGKMIAVKIPKNTHDGMKLRLSGLGKKSGAGKSGDLVLKIKVIP